MMKSKPNRRLRNGEQSPPASIPCVALLGNQVEMCIGFELIINLRTTPVEAVWGWTSRTEANIALITQHDRISESKRWICSVRYGWFVAYNNYFFPVIFWHAHVRSADRLGEDLHDRNKYVVNLSRQIRIWKALSIDEILSKYGKEMTWDIKAGCMGKRKLYPKNQPKFDSIFQNKMYNNI